METSEVTCLRCSSCRRCLPTSLAQHLQPKTCSDCLAKKREYRAKRAGGQPPEGMKMCSTKKFCPASSFEVGAKTCTPCRHVAKLASAARRNQQLVKPTAGISTDMIPADMMDGQDISELGGLDTRWGLGGNPQGPEATGIPTDMDGDDSDWETDLSRQLVHVVRVSHPIDSAGEVLPMHHRVGPLLAALAPELGIRLIPVGPQMACGCPTASAH